MSSTVSSPFAFVGGTSGLVLSLVGSMPETARTFCSSLPQRAGNRVLVSGSLQGQRMRSLRLISPFQNRVLAQRQVVGQALNSDVRFSCLRINSAHGSEL